MIVSHVKEYYKAQGFDLNVEKKNAEIFCKVRGK